MKRTILTVLLAAVAFVAASADSFQPKANEKAVVIQGNARFTVLTDRLIRMEWSEDGVFEDRASFGIVNRNLPVPDFKVRKSAGSLTINTGKVVLTYKGNGSFDEKNLSATFTMNGRKQTWRPGMSDEGNLLGTARTLDKFAGDETMDPYDKGVCSRDGWAIIDESSRHLFKEVDADWKYWVDKRPEGNRQDLYLFAYGHDYTAAVGDFAKVAGNIPLPPKYSFGYWWCRYWMYSDEEVRDLIRHFRDFNIPMDVFIIDMDWHKTWGYENGKKQRDAAGERLGWTGYTWDEVLFPDPEALLQDMLKDNIKTSLNLHPASGLQPYEEPYQAFVKDYTSRTSDYDGPKGYVDAEGKPVFVPFRMSQMEWADAYFNSVIGPLEKQGVSFWWLDWQQFRESKYVDGLSNTFWLNYTFWNDLARRSASQGKAAPRPMIYHRWGGIGSHRYQVGFSGDTYATWKVLGALPYFTYTASNVGYCYWGHDIGGHMQPKGVDFTNPELYTRWMQSGVFTPIYKSHSTKDLTMEKRFWMFPEHFDAMRAAIRLRYDLAPYIYTAAREAFDTGIGLCRPLYYNYPEVEKAYTEKQEFFFGPDILATTVCEPADPLTGLAPRTMWFPEGDEWFDMATGRMYQGGTDAQLSYAVNENPWFVRSGAVIPLAGSSIASLQEASNELRLRVAPGMGEFTTSVYEDDGCSQAYPEDFCRTTVRKNTVPGLVTVDVEARQGSYAGAPATRKVGIELECAAMPSKVLLNGMELPFSYDGFNLRVIAWAPESSAGEALHFEFHTDFAFTNGERGLVCRMRDLNEAGKLQYAKNTGNATVPFELMKFCQVGSIITAHPEKAAELISALDKEALKAEFAKYSKVPAEFADKVLNQTEIYCK